MDSIKQFFERLFYLSEDIPIIVDNTTKKGIALKVEFDSIQEVSLEQMRNIEDFFEATQVYYKCIWTVCGYDDEGYYMAQFTIYTTSTQFYS